jgi:hypothetical protein
MRTSNKTIRPFVLVLTLSCCAPAGPPPPEIVWSKNVPQTPAAQEAFQAQGRKDQFQCAMIARNSSITVPARYQGWLDPPIPDEMTQRQDIFRECMAAQGYTAEIRR